MAWLSLLPSRWAQKLLGEPEMTEVARPLLLPGFVARPLLLPGIAHPLLLPGVAHPPLLPGLVAPLHLPVAHLHLPPTDDGGSDSSFTATKPKSSSQITKPSAANIRTVKSLFQELYPDLTQEGQDREYTGFRARLDVLCTRYLRPSLALSNQEKDEVNKVYTKMTETFQWLTHYNNYWPVSGSGQVNLTHHVLAHSQTPFTDTMVNHRKPVAIRKCFLRELRSRHYSTSHYAPRFACTPTHIDPDASCYPLVESNFSDAAHQPWFHDFKVQLQHGKKVSRFRIFMKRGKALNPNTCDNSIAGDVVIMRVTARDRESVVNMCSTDSRVADYIFHAALECMTQFQSTHRTRPPKELIVKRQRVFPGSP
ncbi:hypothetical protein DFH09DRAFT_1319161 [Mycena vulgaris]|nr:hypothetical protein DFH09DRAFT_1319161 [Mycena vulgaris]